MLSSVPKTCSRLRSGVGQLVRTRSLAVSSSVSPKEIDKFSSLDNEWWDPRKNPLIHMNAVRMQYMQDMIAKHHRRSETSVTHRTLEGLQALDIGCGGGLACESLARLGATVTGVDPSDQLVRAAQAHSQLDPKTQSITYIGGQAAEDLARDRIERYDIVCLLEVVEHATNVPSLLGAASQMLKPDGLLFLSTINRTMKSYLLTILGAEYIMRYIPVGTHNWNQYLSPEEVKRIAASANLQEANVMGMVLRSPPLLGNWDWKLDASDVDVNWIGTYTKRNN